MPGKKGVPKTPEHKAKLAAAWSEEKREQVRQRSLGNTFASREWTPEQREARRKLLLAHPPNLGKSPSEETRAKLAASHVGKSPRLSRYGITPERYSEELAAGNRWCCHGRHFVAVSAFSSKKGVCANCQPEHDRKSALKHNYGIDHGWYEAKLAEQGGSCALCGGGPSAGDKYLAVDHNHKTGAVRGVLCSRCNLAIARFDDVENWPARALAYLARYS